jgi:hypothetical protein
MYLGGERLLSAIREYEVCRDAGGDCAASRLDLERTVRETGAKDSTVPTAYDFFTRGQALIDEGDNINLGH